MGTPQTEILLLLDRVVDEPQVVSELALKVLREAESSSEINFEVIALAVTGTRNRQFFGYKNQLTLLSPGV
jgi:hypothetical protein